MVAMDDTATPTEQDALFDDIAAALKQYVLGWHHQTDERGNPVAFSADALDDVLDDAGLMYLFETLYNARFVTADQKKEFALPSTSSTQHSTSSPEGALPTAATTTPTGSAALDAKAATPAGSAGSMGSGGSPRPPGPDALMTPVRQQQQGLENESSCSPASIAAVREGSPSPAIPAT